MRETRGLLDPLIGSIHTPGEYPLSSVHEALRGVSKLMMQNYLESCATHGIRSDDPEAREETYEELLKVIYRFVR